MSTKSGLAHTNTILPLSSYRHARPTVPGVAQVSRTGVTRDRLTVPISPVENPDEQHLFEPIVEGAKQLYLPEYYLAQEQVSGVPRYRMQLSAQSGGWVLRVELDKSMSEALIAQGVDAEEMPHSADLLLAYRFSPGNSSRKELLFDEVSTNGTMLSATLRIEELALRDEVFRALTELSLDTRLTVRRKLRVAIATGEYASSLEYQLIMTNVGRAKIAVIKVIRAFTGLGLRESKALVERPVPVVLQSGLDKSSAHKLHKALVRAGASCEIRQQKHRVEMQALSGKLKLELLDKRKTEVRGKPFVQFAIGTSNWQLIDNSLFRPAPELPPCGSNTQSSRSWVSILGKVRGKNRVLYSYCALSSSRDLEKLVFNLAPDALPETLFLVITDRSTGKKISSQILDLNNQPDRPAPPDRVPPRGAPLYREVDLISDQPVTPVPFVFDAQLHDYIFGVDTGNGGGAGLIRVQKRYQGTFFPYYQDAARRNVFYYMPDSCRLARHRHAPFYPDMSVRITSVDGQQENTLAAMTYRLMPHVDVLRLESARKKLQQGLRDRGDGREVDLQPFPMDDFRYFVAYPSGATRKNEQRDVSAEVLREGFRDTLEMPLADFVSLFSSMAGQGSLGMTGSLEVSIPGIGNHDIGFRAEFDDMVGEVVELGIVRGALPNTFDISLSNAIESSLRIEQLSAQLVQGDDTVEATIEADIFPTGELIPDDSLVFSVSLESHVELGDDDFLSVGVQRYQVLPDQAALWSVIADRGSTEFYRLITVQALESFFVPDSDEPGQQIVSILVHFEGGDTIELSAGQLQATARVDYLVDNIVLRRPVDPSYRYAVDIIRVQGPEPRSAVRSDTVETFFISVGH